VNFQSLLNQKKIKTGSFQITLDKAVCVFVKSLLPGEAEASNAGEQLAEE
jgi:hypothetical protein